jgi:hypothetical protein
MTAQKETDMPAITILSKKRTTIEIIPVDAWIFDYRQLVNNREVFYCQIIQSDLQARLKMLKMEGFEIVKQKKSVKVIN